MHHLKVISGAVRPRIMLPPSCLHISSAVTRMARTVFGFYWLLPVTPAQEQSAETFRRSIRSCACFAGVGTLPSTVPRSSCIPRVVCGNLCRPFTGSTPLAARDPAPNVQRNTRCYCTVAAVVTKKIGLPCHSSHIGACPQAIGVEGVLFGYRPTVKALIRHRRWGSIWRSWRLAFIQRQLCSFQKFCPQL